MTSLSRHLQTLRQLATLPVAQLRFVKDIEPDNVLETYRNFTKPHPKFKFIQHKSWGAALIDFQECGSFEAYLDKIKGHNLGGYHARRARARGYLMTEIDRNRYVDDIHAINTSIEERQGRPMDAHYQLRQSSFERVPNFNYFGVLKEGKLMAYANLGLYGNFSALSQLMGCRNNDGIMHLLMVEIVARLMRERRVRYLMYDTYFGAQPGLRQFKTILGFSPYRAKYSLQ